MLILDASFPAGTEIKDAILEALQFAEKHHVMVRAELNDVKLTLTCVHPSTPESLVDYYLHEYHKQQREHDEIFANYNKRSKKAHKQSFEEAYDEGYCNLRRQSVLAEAGYV